MSAEYEQLEEQINALVDGELTHREAEALQRQIAADPRLQRLERDIRAVREAVRSRIPLKPEPTDLWEGVRQGMTRIDDTQPARRRGVNPWAVLLPVAAAAALVIGLPKLLSNRRPPAPPPQLAAHVQTITFVSLDAGFEHHSHGTCLPYREGLSTDEASNWLSGTVGFPVAAPQFVAAGLKLMRAGPCICASRDKAALMVTRDSHGLVMFWQFAPGRHQLAAAAVKNADGRRFRISGAGTVKVIAWQQGTTCYAMASQRAVDDLVKIANTIVPPHGCDIPAK